MPEDFSFQSYAWSLGTTSFRMADFHRKVEEQLIIINDFWSVPSNHNLQWNPNTQKLYYDFAYERGFITGDLAGDDASKSKTARQKTSGLVDIGLIQQNRRLTDVGARLLSIAQSGNFASDNEFQIPADSFLYLKQIMKTDCPIQKGCVRPFLVTGKVLQACDGYLTDDEFTFLLPLCVSKDVTDDIIAKIHTLRAEQTTIDGIICDTVLTRYNYPEAVDYFVRSDKTDEDFKIVGMNRKSSSYDSNYVALYGALAQIYLNDDNQAITSLLEASKGVKNKPGTLWRAMLFDNPRSVINASNLRKNDFYGVTNEEQFARRFFKYMHLFKIKANLSDYQDLNKRYLNITDAFLFDDGKVTFTPLFENFFRTEAGRVFEDSYTRCDYLTMDCAMNRINQNLVFNPAQVINVFNESENQNISSMDEMYDFLEHDRYNRFRHLIDTRFPNDTIISVLDSCENRRNDDELVSLFGGEADVPTIFEYIVGIAWYRLSRYQGKILDYMNLSLDVSLLPRTHAGGGESDIVYKYTATDDYPEHALLIECTLMEGTTQRRGEMEPVSRHLANYMIDKDENAYCTFVSNNLHASVVSDFRGRKLTPYYRNDTEHVDSMKIIPLHTRELKSILKKDLSYNQIYRAFDEAYRDISVKAPPEWYNTCVKAGIDIL